MPFDENTFDGPYFIEATCHAPELEEVYAEIFRVMKPGSLYVSYEWVTRDREKRCSGLSQHFFGPMVTGGHGFGLGAVAPLVPHISQPSKCSSWSEKVL
ncbi:unnamed protein product [Brassica napus]|uniref:(rape) hypothetical protein n=1 Tax=Brassica napus TaxID=3708 RepID=A0A816K4D6_BRANA|nr:unnamed protein product [Brassica napus]